MIEREADGRKKLGGERTSEGGQRWGAEEISQKTGGGGREKQNENKKTTSGGADVSPRHHELQSAALCQPCCEHTQQNPLQ